MSINLHDTGRYSKTSGFADLAEHFLTKLKVAQCRDCLKSPKL